MGKFNFEKMDKKKLIVIGVVAAVTVICIVALVIKGDKNSSSSGGDKNLSSQNSDSTDKNNSTDENGSTDSKGNLNSETTTVPETESDNTGNLENDLSDSGQDYEFNHVDNGGASVNVDKYADNHMQQAIGIDVSRYQGKIDWSEVAASGIEFAIIRVGYRTTISGEICEDPYAAYNLTNAGANNINTGVYFFSSAISEEEAKKEAEWTVDYISKYNITYPVVYNCEGFDNSDSRQYGIGMKERSNFAKIFLDTVKEAGYTPMFYASVTELNNSAKWDTQMLSDTAKIWVAWYPDLPYPDTESAVYNGVHHMWQYTSNGEVRGISKPVDIDVSYLGIESMAHNFQGNVDDSKASDQSNEPVTISPEADMIFRDTDEEVQPKQEVNLRNRPSQDTDAGVLFSVKNGEVIRRTGISDSGWSRVVYNGQVCYAVSSYLTTDLSYVYSDNNNGIKTKFRDVDETVTPKEEVNLRNIPSVTEDASVIIATVYNGDMIRRTGISDEMGWSRVEYNGQTLYCISSYLE